MNAAEKRDWKWVVAYPEGAYPPTGSYISGNNFESVLGDGLEYSQNLVHPASLVTKAMPAFGVRFR